MNIFELREILPDAIRPNAKDLLVTVESRTCADPYTVTVVRSDSGRTYEIVSLGAYYYKCNCPARGVCRHIRRIYPHLCRRCSVRMAEAGETLCSHCAPVVNFHVKPSSGRVPTLIGNYSV